MTSITINGKILTILEKNYEDKKTTYAQFLMENKNMLKGVLFVALGASFYGMLATFVKVAYDQGYTTAEVTASQFVLGIITLLIINLSVIAILIGLSAYLKSKLVSNFDKKKDWGTNNEGKNVIVDKIYFNEAVWFSVEK